MAATLHDALDYEPRPLRFGTSGLRGLVTDLTQLEAATNTLGFLRFLAKRSQISAGDTVCVAGDLRPSTTQPVELEGRPRGEILQAVVWAIQQAGYQPAHLGAVPTPALMHHALNLRCASVMVTGSHIPYDRNGIKFNKPDGEVLKNDESDILEHVSTVREELLAQPVEQSPFAPNGQLQPRLAVPLPPVNPAGSHAYLQRYLRAFPTGPLQNRRILVYQHSAVGRDLLVELLTALGAQTIPAGRSEVFIPIDTEAVSPAMLDAIQKLVDTCGEPELDAVVSTDGDSDRPLLLGVDQGQVRFFGGDLLGIVVADFLGARQVAVPISANDAVDRYFAARNVSVVKTRIGSPYVINAMREVGWEANGGFLTAATCRVPHGGTLSPLPTRDAFLPLLAALYASLGRGQRLVDHFSSLPKRFGKADVLRDFPRELSQRILERFQPADPDVEEVWFEAQGAQIRHTASPERQPASSEQDHDLQHRRSELESALQPHLGHLRVTWMNFCDGVRLGTADGELLHFRPSGNAPEQRVYAVADSQRRADQLVQSAIQPGGIIDALRAALAPQAPSSAKPADAWPWLELQGVVRHYDWGGTRFIPEWLHRPNPSQQPFAELWFGSHPAAPSLVRTGGLTTDLRQILHTNANAILGPGLAATLGPELPYLLKILDAREMLSIQAHPDRPQAQAGFARENAAGIPLDATHRNYKDPHPKPEVHVALTPFWLLHGFRPLDELAAELDRTPELARAWPTLHTDLQRVGQDAAQRPQLLRALYEHVMRLPQPDVDAILQPLLQRLAVEEPTDKSCPDFWAHRAARTFARPDGTCDRGLFSIYLLNLVYLQPGQSTFQDAGVLHAYLEGSTAELMACSDNVLRGGLTAKHVDVTELLHIVRFEEGQPHVSSGDELAEGEWAYPAHAAEFELRRLSLQPGSSKTRSCSTGPECLLMLAGELQVRVGTATTTLQRGTSLLIPAGHTYTLAAATDSSTVLCARVPDPGRRD